MLPPQGYCVICQVKRELTDAKRIERSGLPAIEGKCTVCGTKVFLLGAGAPVEADEGPST